MRPRCACRNTMVLLACAIGKGRVIRGAFRTTSHRVARRQRTRPIPGLDWSGCPNQRRLGSAPRASISVEASRPSANSPTIELRIPTSDVMEEVGGLLYSVIDDEATAAAGRPGVASAVICLDGDLGAGKTALSRGFVRAATGDWSLRVTSPTYLLSNAYRTRHHEIHHMDLYRLGSTDDLSPLNLPHVLQNCLSLIEWPERVSALLPEDRLDVRLTIVPAEAPSMARCDDDDDDGAAPRTMVLRPRGDLWIGRILQLVDDGSLDDLLV